MFQTERNIYRYLESVSDVFPMPFRCLSDAFPIFSQYYIYDMDPAYLYIYNVIK